MSKRCAMSTKKFKPLHANDLAVPAGSATEL